MNINEDKQWIRVFHSRFLMIYNFLSADEVYLRKEYIFLYNMIIYNIIIHNQNSTFYLHLLYFKKGTYEALHVKLFSLSTVRCIIEG